MWDWLRQRRPRTDRALGGRGEKLAARHLRKQGYRLLGKNIRTSLGEIDLLALAPGRSALVVVEVKTGQGGPLPPEIRVGRAKQRKLAQLAAQIQRRRSLPNLPIRFDVVGVDLPEGAKPTIRHHVGAFESPF
ncbi:MAG: YraN family protein [Phycisphaeraceae bacterium]